MQSDSAGASTKPAAKVASSKHSGTHTIDLQETFYARAQDIFECFTQAGKIQAFTQSPAEAQPEVNGIFSMFGGSVQGSYRKLVPFSSLQLEWRFGNWPDDAKSLVSWADFVLCSISSNHSLHNLLWLYAICDAEQGAGVSFTCYAFVVFVQTKGRD